MEADAILCFLGYVLLNRQAGKYRAEQRIPFRVVRWQPIRLPVQKVHGAAYGATRSLAIESASFLTFVLILGTRSVTAGQSATGDGRSTASSRAQGGVPIRDTADCQSALRPVRHCDLGCFSA